MNFQEPHSKIPVKATCNRALPSSFSAGRIIGRHASQYFPFAIMLRRKGAAEISNSPERFVCMKAIVVVGAQWGDEGKGKIVDYVASSFDYVARYAGGHNAGHTVIFDNQRF